MYPIVCCFYKEQIFPNILILLLCSHTYRKGSLKKKQLVLILAIPFLLFFACTNPDSFPCNAIVSIAVNATHPKQR